MLKEPNSIRLKCRRDSRVETLFIEEVDFLNVRRICSTPELLSLRACYVLATNTYLSRMWRHGSYETMLHFFTVLVFLKRQNLAIAHRNTATAIEVASKELGVFSMLLSKSATKGPKTHKSRRLHNFSQIFWYPRIKPVFRKCR